MKISPFWLRFLTEANDTASLLVAREVIDAFEAEAEGHDLHQGARDALECWNYYNAHFVIEKFAKALTGWSLVISQLPDCQDDLWEALKVNDLEVEHGCMKKQVYLAQMITTVLMERQEWNQGRLKTLGLHHAKDLFEDEERGENPL